MKFLIINGNPLPRILNPPLLSFTFIPTKHLIFLKLSYATAKGFRDKSIMLYTLIILSNEFFIYLNILDFSQFFMNDLPSISTLVRYIRITLYIECYIRVTDCSIRVPKLVVAYSEVCFKPKLANSASCCWEFGFQWVNYHLNLQKCNHAGMHLLYQNNLVV